MATHFGRGRLARARGLGHLRAMYELASSEISRPIVLALVAACALLGSTGESGAPIVETTYEQYAEAVEKRLTRAALSQELGVEDYRHARQMAALWLHIGPCRGKADGADVPGMLQSVFNLNPEYPHDAAVLIMIATFSVETLGREPGAFACQFAQAAANIAP